MRKKAVLFILFSFSLISCYMRGSISGEEKKQIVLLTNIKEAPLYAEMFNSENDSVTVSLRYSENPASLIGKHGIKGVDIVMAPYLRNRVKNFNDASSVLPREKKMKTGTDEDDENSEKEDYEKFYPSLLQAGRGQGGLFSLDTQRLIPISFNIAAAVFDMNNENYLDDNEKDSENTNKDDITITLDGMKKASASFDKKDKKGYSCMGFVPVANDEFMYLVTSICGADWNSSNTPFAWNDEGLSKGILYLKEWSSIKTSDAVNFAYKYLSTPIVKQVTSGRCLFSVTDSGNLFQLSSNPLALTNIGYRYIVDERGRAIVADEIVMIGALNGRWRRSVKKFIEWFTDEDTQKRILERKKEIDLEMAMFGIAGGFSAIKAVNEELGNAPECEIAVKEPLPCEWQKIKENVIVPYIKDALLENGKKGSLINRASEWEAEVDKWT